MGDSKGFEGGKVRMYSVVEAKRRKCIMEDREMNSELQLMGLVRYICQLSFTQQNTGDYQFIKRKGIFWLTISPFSLWLALLLEAHGKAAHHSGEHVVEQNGHFMAQN